MAERPQVPSWAPRAKEGVGETQPWGAPLPPPWVFPHRPEPAEKAAVGRREEEAFPTGAFLFSLPNRKSVPEGAEMLPAL